MKSEVLDTIMIKSPIGTIQVLNSKVGVREISLDQEYTNNKSIIDLDYGDTDVTVICHDGPHHESSKATIKWLQMFFSKKRELFKLQTLPPIDNQLVEKDNFTGRVLRTLANYISCGTTISYAGLAGLCGNPKACRAVGQAMRSNPLPLLIPCHRVVTSSGAAGPYMRGNGDNIKKWLIEFERQF